MSTNQEALQFSFKEKHAEGQAATVLESDHMLGYATGGGPSTGAFNERRLGWINTQALPGSPFAGLPQAEQVYAEQQGFTNWSSIGFEIGPTANRDVSFTSIDGTLATVVFSDKVEATASPGEGWSLAVNGGTAVDIVTASFLEDPTDPNARNAIQLTVPASLSPITTGQTVEAFYNAAAGTARDADTGEPKRDQNNVPVDNRTGGVAFSQFGAGFSQIEFL